MSSKPQCYGRKAGARDLNALQLIGLPTPHWIERTVWPDATVVATNRAAFRNLGVQDLSQHLGARLTAIQLKRYHPKQGSTWRAWRGVHQETLRRDRRPQQG